MSAVLRLQNITISLSYRYHKVRRAKDTSGYSAKDLEGIVGISSKRTKENQEMGDIHITNQFGNHNKDQDIENSRPSFSLTKANQGECYICCKCYVI